VGGLRPCLFCLFRGGWGVQNLVKPAYIILERSLSLVFIKIFSSYPSISSWGLHILLLHLGVESRVVGWLGGSLVSSIPMVIVIIVLSMASIPIVPLQLSLKSMVLLREVFFSIMFRVSPSVPPFKCLMCWHIYVLEMVIPPI